MTEAIGSCPDSGSRVLAELVEQVSQRIEAGELVDLEAYCRDYPEQAEQLRQLVPALQVLNDLSGHPPVIPRTDGPADSAALAAAGTLGDFRIVREVGRGGMGVVYEAEQISMGRRVALKVLPFAAVMDPRHLQRFKNEARAAGSLQHPHIVPVHFVGGERGVHYFAMQFIEGQTLAALIQQLRQLAVPDERTTAYPPPDGAGKPDAATEPVARQSTLAASVSPTRRDYFRRVAEWGEQAAEALEHAHQTGIVHRDVKPANLMIDARGHLWVTDFGLAHVHQGEASLTMTGDLVGTLRYMSPEQALAKRVLIDHRTDVYSLGATLYEVLTLQPAYAGTDRQELLRQIAFEEPRPPRRVNKGIPAELEMIVLKALEKNPADRYATAKELADDLWRFTEDRPIRARRPSLRERARKWARRHKGLVQTSAAVLVLAVAALAVSTLLIWRKNEELREAYEAQAAQSQRASSNLHVALEAMEKVYMRLTEEQMWQENPDPRDRELLERLLSFYVLFSKQNAEEPTAREAMAKAHLHIGVIYTKLGNLTSAEKAMWEGIQVSQQMVDAFPATPRYREILISHFVNLGQLIQSRSHDAEAEEVMREGIARCQEAMKVAPTLDLQYRLAALRHNLGGSLGKLERL
jgi:serine/threonine protein kinase